MRKIIKASVAAKSKNRIECATGSIDDMLDAFEDRIDQLENFDEVEMAIDIDAYDDEVCPECGQVPCVCGCNFEKTSDLEAGCEINSGTDAYSDEPEVFVDYAAYLDNYSDYYYEDDLVGELAAVEREIRAYGMNPHNCPVYWRDDYEAPIIKMGENYYYADWRGGEEARLTDVSLVDDLSSLGLPVEVGACDSILSGEISEPGRYCLEDTYGAPQAGLDTKYFDSFDEAQDYILANPDVEDRINQGYAILKEC